MFRHDIERFKSERCSLGRDKTKNDIRKSALFTVTNQLTLTLCVKRPESENPFSRISCDRRNSIVLRAFLLLLLLLFFIL